MYIFNILKEVGKIIKPFFFGKHFNVIDGEKDKSRHKLL